MSDRPVQRRTFTSDDVLRVAASGATTLVVGPHDRLTPLARDLARERGVDVVVESSAAAPFGLPAGGPGSPFAVGSPSAVGSPWGGMPPRAPAGRLTHVASVDRIALDPFPAELNRPQMDVRVRDVITGRDGVPMAAGVLSLREGSFPWHLDYDEIEYVIEGELHITLGSQRVVGRPGDVIAVPKGSSITFGTPSWTKFLYVTYPADWSG